MYSLRVLMVSIHEPLLDKFDGLRRIHVNQAGHIVQDEIIDPLSDFERFLLGLSLLLQLKARLDIVQPDKDILSNSWELEVHLQAFLMVTLHLQKVDTDFEHG